MKNFVFFTGILSIIAGTGFQFSFFSALLLPTERPGVLLHLFGLMAMFLGAMLIFCSRDLKHRGNLVLWEGILRLGGSAIMVGYGVFGAEGVQITIAGLFDFAIGTVYLVGLPRYLGKSFIDLLLDRQTDQ